MARFVSFFSAVVMTLVSSIVASAQSSKPSGEAMEVAKAYDRAILKQDAAAFEKVLSDDFALIVWHGEKHDKAWMVAEAKKGTIKLDIAKRENNVYRSYGDTVVWTGDWTEKGTDDGEPFEKKGPFTTILAKRNGSWKVVADHVTERKPTPNLEGIWKLHARIDDAGNVAEVGADEASNTSRKYISNGNWCVTYADADGGIIFHHGGTYTLKENVYTESIKFAHQSTSNMVGSEFKFNVEVKGDSLIQKGIGNPYNEVWRRAK